jgi:hypothetical protein
MPVLSAVAHNMRQKIWNECALYAKRHLRRLKIVQLMYNSCANWFRLTSHTT